MTPAYFPRIPLLSFRQFCILFFRMKTNAFCKSIKIMYLEVLNSQIFLLPFSVLIVGNGV